MLIENRKMDSYCLPNHRTYEQTNRLPRIASPLIWKQATNKPESE